MPLFIFTGCGDLEPEMQDKRTVILNMDFHGKSSSRSSYSVSASELSQYNTHLILALPSWEYLTSNYRNYYSSFAQGLMNAADKKVSLEIPLNTQMKIFAFLFKDTYSLSDLISGFKEVGYYGESQPFSIDEQTNNLSLGISLQSTDTGDGGGTDPDTDTGTETGDTTAPIIEQVTAIESPTNDSTPEYTFASTKAGSITYAGACYSATIICNIGNNVIVFNALSDGYYDDCTIKIIDSEGNESNTLTIPAFTIDTTVPDNTAPTASVIAATITTSGNAVVQSTETGTAYLVKTTVSVSDVITNNTVPPDSQWNSVTISSANFNTNLPATGLENGTYKVYAVDAAGNLSSPSSNSVTVATNDTTAPTASVTPDNITSSGNAHVQSTETGTAYLVNTAVTVSNLGSITGADDNLTNSVIINLTNTNTMLSATGLVTGKYRVYAKDAAGNLSGASVDNVTIAGLVDIDGNGYSTVVIGTQNWMAENLKVTKYRNGDNITNITTNSAWSTNTSGAYGVYDNDETTYLNSYGRLYNWYAVDNSTGVLCPEGWHVPTTDEYDDLATYLGGVSVAGGKMKETGDTYWQSESSGTTNSSGFTSRGSGRRGYSNGNYASIEDFTYYWSSNFTGSNGYYHLLTYNGATLGGSGSSANKNYGFSVRCLED